MKIGKKTLAFCLASLLLCGCGGGEVPKGSADISGETSSEVVNSSEETTSEETSLSESIDERWGVKLCALMKQYCGVILPYPEGMLGEEVWFEEVTEENGEAKFLRIYDESSKFTLGEYYAVLEEQGWSETVGYNEEIGRTVDSNPYYELNKMAGDKGYNLSYTFQAEEGDIPSGNVIYCRNDFTDKLTSKTDWSAREKENIQLGLNISLPFMALGNGYKVEHPSEDVVLISDRCLTDLCEKYGEALEKDDFILTPYLSRLYDKYIYTKYLDDKTIYVALSYQNGNRFQFDFSAIPEKTSDWPKDALADIESKSGITIPEFEVTEDLHYYYNYTKNEKVYVYAETPVDIEHSTDYFKRLKEAGFANDGSGNFTNKDKGVKLDTKVLMNESMGQWEQYGFQIIVYLA